ncbi:transcriptional regulator [Microbacterium protaetiae]|uniref:Transcriptional regulator n=1 Tax=Microbacterium protaetiae TaxID=2509458 RepID=A0A4P6EF36_9MICO|nr:metalloregulator ArsR/SmtB family transcription factor [Microbacterium protaetiae]QAY60972.1 transcriptional regulator [Microbacterium protaetiae]
MSTRTELPITPVGIAACCSPLTAGVIDDASAAQLARVFKALGDPTRVRLISLIAAAEGAEACICELTDPVGLSQPTVSHHMRLLVQAGLVTREQRGKWAYYRLVGQTFNALREAVTVGIDVV